MKNRNIKAPLSKKVARVPVVIQLEALECGAACLTMILAYYNKWIPLEKVRLDCGVSRDGSSAVNIIKAARAYGLDAGGYKFEVQDLKEDATFPCIIHWNFNHFVVLDGFRGNKAYINDPAMGKYSVTMDVFDECFTGVCLMFEPSESFVPSGTKKSLWAFSKKRIAGLRVPIIIAVLSSAITALINLIAPVFNRVFYDRLLTGLNPDWATPFIFALSLLFGVQIITECITSYVNFRINGKMSIVGNLSYMWKVLHLPMHFFSQRYVGDINSRRSGNEIISNTLVNTVSPLFINGIMMLFYLVVMARYSLVLTAIGLLSVVANIFVSQYISARRVNIDRVRAREAGKLASSTVSGISMIETIKASGAEEGFFEKWAGNFASLNSITQKFTRESQVLAFIPSVISSVASNLMIALGVYFTVCGSFTLGSVIAFQGFFTAFMNPVNSLMTAGETIQQMRTGMERIDDVMEYPSDENITDVEFDKGNIKKLSGKIEIKNVTFGYSPLAQPLIKDFSMNIEKGSRVAFVGASGCGKSTLSKLISGIYSPWQGEILFDGKKISEIDHCVFTGSLAVVDQDIVMFEGTVANNIKMWDGSIEDFEMILAAKDADMHFDIVAKDGGYSHKIVEGGKDFSGGQRQRLEIARVLAQEPNIIILDEATSALDAATEYKVVKAIKDRGITCIVIAHRLSTVRDCDEIVVLDKGTVVERGTHEELLKLGGSYAELVTND